MEKATIETDLSQVYSNRGLLISGLVIAMLFAALDGTIVGTAMPRIIGDLGGLGLMVWLTTAYMLSSTIIIPVAGKLSDLLGRKTVYLSGLLIFIVGSVLCGMAHSMVELIIYRAVQGIGGGVMMPLAMIIVGDVYTGTERAKWQGVFGGLFGLSSVIGPLVGGWIVDYASWRWVFYINLPFGVAAVILLALGLPKHLKTGKVNIDLAGIVTMSIGVMGLLLALTFGGKELAWSSWQMISLLSLSFLFLGLFVWIETKASEPIVPMHFFKDRAFTVINGIGFFMSIGMFGAMMFVPLFLQGIKGVSPSDSGTVLMPLMITMIAASMVSSLFIQKLGVRRQLASGMLIMAIGFILMMAMGEDTSKLTVAANMLLLGFGMGLVMPVLTVALQESYPDSELGVVTSSSTFFRQIGGTFGMTILGVIMNIKSSEDLKTTLVPQLQQLPPTMDEWKVSMTALAEHDPQQLFSSLLSPNTLSQLPPAIISDIVPLLKILLVDALHTVFLWGALLVLIGFFLTPLTGKIKIKTHARMKERSNISLH